MFLLIDKPKGITSHDVIDEVRKVTGERRVGHAGTLDPNATGLLLVGVGRESTKKLGKLALKRKTYEAEIVLGEERDTGDVEGQSTRIPQQVRSSQRANSVRDDKTGLESLPVLSNVRGVLASFLGEQEQVPPVYSAIKIKGKKAYELARRGKKVNLKPRRITVHSIELLDYHYPIIKIKTSVSSGTYIRALARDIGRKLDTGAYLDNLRRTKLGKYDIEDAIKLKDLSPDNWKEKAFDL
jgi:tRNA pseudouridine55 synthase